MIPQLQSRTENLPDTLSNYVRLFLMTNDDDGQKYHAIPSLPEEETPMTCSTGHTANNTWCILYAPSHTNMTPHGHQENSVITCGLKAAPLVLTKTNTLGNPARMNHVQLV